MKTNFFIITIVTTFMFSSSVFAQVDGPILNGVDNTRVQNNRVDKYGQRSLDLCKLVDAFWTEYFFGATRPHTLLVPTNEAFSKCP
jgi:hypothetical protein